MKLNTEPERLTRDNFAASKRVETAGLPRKGFWCDNQKHTVMHLTENIAHDHFGIKPKTHSDCHYSSTNGDAVECLDCGWSGPDSELSAQACPICDGRVKDLQ